MKILIAILAVWLPFASVAQEVERITGDKAKSITPAEIEALPVTAGPAEGPYSSYTVADLATLPFKPVVYRGATEINMPPEFIHDVREGLELLYLRRYQDARDHFREVETRFPHTALGSVSDVLVWQALMLENFDFKFEKQYWVSSAEARKALTEAMAMPGNEGWEYFLMTGVSGIESIHTMRRSQYLKALQLAFEAIGYVNKVREYAPSFTDLILADGMYNYWRTVVTMNSKLLPDFGDKRAEGIAQMRHVEQGGVFLSAPTTLALVFTWQEENNMKEALTSCVKNYRKYPDNIVNNMVMGSTYVYTKRYKLALEAFDRISKVDPNNQRVKYWRGVAFMRSGQPQEAINQFESYLNGSKLEDYQRAYTYYRLGQVHAKLTQWAKAEEYYKLAVKENGHEPAKSRLENMKAMKKSGKISY